MTRLVAAICLAIAVLASTSAHAQYWKIGNDAANVWSLSGDAIVTVSNTAYVAWLAAGNLPSTIASTNELYDVLAASYPTHLAASAPALDSYGGLSPQQAFAWRKEAGLNIVYTGAASLNGRYAVDDQWLGGIMTAALLRCGTTALDACSTALPFGASTYAYFDASLTK